MQINYWSGSCFEFPTLHFNFHFVTFSQVSYKIKLEEVNLFTKAEHAEYFDCKLLLMKTLTYRVILFVNQTSLPE